MATSLTGTPRQAGAAPTRDGVRQHVSARAATLLGRADALLSEAAGAGEASERFHHAYLAALRGAGAVLAAAALLDAGRSRVRRPRSRNAWVLMAGAVPDFVEWADYFADRSGTRAAIEAGISRTVGDREADEFFVEVGRFLHAVEDYIGADARLGPTADCAPGMTA